MSLARTVAPLPFDRRTAPRVRVCRTALLRTSFANIDGELWDLSAMGARFLTETPPREGVTALLEWDTHDAFGRVVWSQEGMCGLQFDRPIPHALIDEASAPAPRPGTVVSLGNIPLGKRRSLLSRGE